MKIDLSGKVALVCGASRGIGRGIAEAFAEAGAELALVARDPEKLASAAGSIERASGRNVLQLPGDVSDPEFSERAVRETARRYGRLDILVNNAGGPPMGSFLEHGLDTWDAAYRTSLRSVVSFTRCAVPGMRVRRFGRIINITSVLGKEPTPLMVLSGTLRAGVSAYSKAIATELAPDGITVNTLAPSAVFTERAETLTRQTAEREARSYEEALGRATSALPIRRFASIEEFAAVAVFIASDNASYITGVTLPVDGGLSRGVF